MSIKIKSDLINGLALAKMDKTYGYVNSFGRVAIPFVFKDALPFSEGFAAVKMKGFTEGWNFINVQGQRVIGGDFIEARSFKQGRAAVVSRQISKTLLKDKYGWGFIDYKGNRIVDCYYEFANDYNDGFVWVKGKASYIWYLLDWNGYVILTLPKEEEPKELFNFFGLSVGYNQSDIPHIAKIGIVENGWAQLVIDNKVGFVNINGNIHFK